MHMHLHHMHNYFMGGPPEGLTEPDMVEAAQQLVHLSGDEEESDDHCRRGAKPAGVDVKAATLLGGDHEGKMTTEAKRAVEDSDDEDEKKATTSPRKKRFRSIAYIYKVTRPVRLYDEAKRRKNH
uniref:Disabled 2 n=1 Tax=Anthurium amnicola TaxID=1678845 RepID=A0A1D1XZG1_9ARAE